VTSGSGPSTKRYDSSWMQGFECYESVGSVIFQPGSGLSESSGIGTRSSRSCMPGLRDPGST
jgi:hypothetical protein